MDISCHSDHSSSFYTIEKLASYDRRWQWLEPSRRLEQLCDNAWARLLADDPSLPEPVPLKVFHGVWAPDLFGCTTNRPFLSGRLVRALRDLGASGLCVKRCILYDRADREVIDDELYWYLPQIGAGPIDETRGSILMAGRVLKTGTEFDNAVGVHFDHSTWTGLDLFMPMNGITICVTPRVAHLIREGGYRGIRIQSVEEHGRWIRDIRVAEWRDRHGKGASGIADRSDN